MSDAVMSAAVDGIVRTPRGLTVKGTRITLYDIMDYVRDGWPVPLIADWLRLTDCQIEAAIGYIESHRAAVDAEYQQVLRQAEENREYWENRNRERFERIRMASPSDRHELRERVRLWRERQVV